jgi:hypothetical protein
MESGVQGIREAALARDEALSRAAGCLHLARPQSYGQQEIAT